jgi:hypothetical protein
LPRVLTACLVARDHPAITVRGAIAVSWSLPPATHVNSHYHLHHRELSTLSASSSLFAPLLFANRDIARAAQWG